MRVDFQVVKQSVKWIVYSLLLVNFALYLNWDWHAATHSMAPAEPLIKWLQAYAASIDYAAWLVLILLFELETYVLSDEVFTPMIRRSVHGLRLLCYLFVLHTVYAYSVEVYEVYFEVKPVPEVSNLCQVADKPISFVYNQKYTYLNEDNCAELGTGSDYFLLDKGRVIADLVNLDRERWLAWLDLVEVNLLALHHGADRIDNQAAGPGSVKRAGSHQIELSQVRRLQRADGYRGLLGADRTVPEFLG